MGDPFTYIRNGEILTGEDGIIAKVKAKASDVVNKLKKSLNIDKSRSIEEVPDELINNLVSAFKDGALKFKPGLETKRDNSSLKTTSNQSTEINHSTDGNKNVTVKNSTKEGSATWKDGGHATFTLGGDHIVDGGAGAYLDADYNISSKRTEKESDPNSDDFNYKGVDVDKSAKGNVKFGGHVEVCGRRFDVPIDVHGEANCGYSHSKEDGTIHYQTIDDNKLTNTTESKHERSVGARSRASGGLSVMNNSIKADAGARFDAGCFVSSKHVDGESLPNIDGYKYEGTETEYAAAAHFNSDANLNASVDVLGKTAGVNATGKLKADGRSVKMSASGKVAAKAVDAKADLTVQTDEQKTSIGGVHANIGQFSARGRAGIQWPGADEKRVEAEADFNLASVNALQAEVREKEESDEADIHIKGGLVNANIANAKVVGKKTGKKATMTMDGTLAEVNAANVSITGIDNRESNRTRVNARVKTTATANIGNVDITGLGCRETRFDVNTAPGVDAFNFRCGIHRNTGGSVSTNRTSFCNIDLSIGPPNWNISFGNNVGNIAIPFFGGGGGGGGGGGSSSGGNPNQSGEEDDDDGTGAGGNGTGTSGNGTGIAGNGTGTGGNGTSGNGTGTGGNGTGTGGNGTGTAGNGTDRNGTGTGGNGTGGNGTGTGGNGTDGNGTGTDGNVTGGNGTGTGGNGTGGNSTGGNGTGTGGIGYQGTGNSGRTIGHGRNGTGTNGNGTGGISTNGNGTGGIGYHGTGRNGTGTGGNGYHGTGNSGRTIGRGGNGPGTGRNGTSRGGNRIGRSGNDNGRSGNDNGRSGNDNGRSGNDNGRSGNDNGRSGNDNGRSGIGTGSNILLSDDILY
ncbi:hypothetical protein LOTGIDRAFT_157674 [Lottia gigantea]|uniref:Uncharacterized protein n=1 Tax=Lottia gigantea TaxID=225164 RepID=V4B2D0_LOTGI|nr:hypothetical protein LOTGIDRAFT_157674 [Lottia gigantea]ESP00467.1 hypothetical protein LOTGIDRAFT_157674 [Lottia gigantea]